MSFVQGILDFFQSLFMSNNPEVKKRQEMKKVENQLKEIAPHLYKNNLVQVNFAEALKTLYFNIKPIQDILMDTLCSADVKRNRFFEEQLILTGLNENQRKILDELEYSNRRDNAIKAPSINRYFEAEHRKLNDVVKEMKTPEFMKIDTIIDKLNQLNDLCKFNYVNTLKLFDANFMNSPTYQSDFHQIPIDLLETALCDLYYVICDLDITVSMYNALLALLSLKKGQPLNGRDMAQVRDNLKKIQGINKHIFNKEVLTLLIRIAKKNTEYTPSSGTYKMNALTNYCEYLEKKFLVDEDRLKGEIHDLTISNEVNEIFGENPLMILRGYNTELNSQLTHSSTSSFMWVMPMQILKTFTSLFYEAHIRPFLNDVVIEGFFNNPAYKSDFSSVVFACNEIMDNITAFESKFNRGNEYDEANISGLLKDCHKDVAFEITLKDLVDKINKDAKNILQKETNNINSLYKKIKDIIVDSKKPNASEITNLKVLMISSRNKDNAEYLEGQSAQWKVFLDIMKNYVIIGTVEKKS